MSTVGGENNGALHVWHFAPQTAREFVQRVVNPRGIAVLRPFDARYLGRGSSFDLNVEPFRASERFVVLQHEHYKAVYDRRRRMPLVSYAIVDVARRISTPLDGSRIFALDPLVAERDQFGPEAYENDAYDRGHLTQRRSVAWGASLDEALDAQQQSDYYTNIVPQQLRFNRVVWAAVEDECRRLVVAANGDGAFSRRSIEVTGVWFDRTRTATYDEAGDSATAATSHRRRRRRVPDAFWKCCIVSGAPATIHCFFVPHVESVWSRTAPRAADFSVEVAFINARLGYAVDKYWHGSK